MINNRLIRTNDAGGGGTCYSVIGKQNPFLDDSTRGYFRFNDNLNDNDSIGNLQSGSSTYGEGIYNKALYLNGNQTASRSSTFYGNTLDGFITNGNQPYTVSIWFKVTQGSKRNIVWYVDAATARDTSIEFGSDNRVYFGGGTGTFVVTPTSQPTNVWHHAVVSFDGVNINCYLNGTFIGSNTSRVSNLVSSCIAHQAVGLTGYVDEFRLFNRALSEQEAVALYTGEYCPPACTTNTNQLVPDCIAYYKLDGNADDQLNTYDGTPSNVSWTQGRFGSAANFSTSGSFINLLPSFGSFFNQKQTLSVSIWWKWDGTTDNNIFADYANSSFNISLNVNKGGTGKISLVTRYSNATTTTTSTTSTFNDGNWHHAVAVINQSNLTHQLYVDNVLEGANNISSASWNGSSQGVNIGGQNFAGQIDQVRIYDRAITAAEVETLYNEVQCPSNASFNTVLYTGNGSTQNVGGVGFQPDFVWIKDRTSGSENHWLFDVQRGGNIGLSSNLTGGDYTLTNTLSSFNDSGFTVGSDGKVNRNNDNYVAWNFKAGGSAVTNTDGTITSQVSANTEAGFSIVSYTGNGANATIGHGLNNAPDVLIVKRRNASGSWNVYHSALGNNSTLILQLTIAELIGEGTWGTTTPTSSVFTAGTGINDTNNYIAYCFAEVAGFSKFGSWNNIGPVGTINMGFEPAMVIIKKVDGTDNWRMYDNKRDTSGINNNELYPNLSNAEYTLTNFATFTSTGLDFTGGNPFFQTGQFIYMAFADQF